MAEKIMVVDDDPVVRILVTEFLTSQGYSVNVVENGEECLRSLKETRPDILLVDCIMPDINGFDVIRSVRNNPQTADLPIVMMSSEIDTEALAHTHNVSADAYVLKPFGMREILMAVQNIKNGSQN